MLPNLVRTACLLGFLLPTVVQSQNIPVFSQKLSDGFLVNPALSGISGGSITTNYANQWSSVQNAPDISYLGAHLLNKNENLGYGVNGYFEKTAGIQIIHLALTGAYHAWVGEKTKLSLGLSAEYRRAQLDVEEMFVLNPDDPLIINFDSENDLDFSTGFHLSHPKWDAGISFRRLSRFIFSNDDPSIFSGLVTSYFNFYQPVRYGQDILEPRIMLRRTQEGESQLDAMLFYTINKEVIVGLNYRTQSIIGGSAGYVFNHRYVLGYTILTGVGVGGQDLGLSHEIVFRFNFNRQYFNNYNPEDNVPPGSFTFKKKHKKS